MAYSKQTYVSTTVWSATRMARTNDNIAQHVHGRNSVVRTGISFPRSEIVSDTTLTAADVGKLLECNSGPFTITLPSAAAVDAGWAVTLRNVNPSQVFTLTPDGSETIGGGSSKVLGLDALFVYSDGVNMQTIEAGALDTAQSSGSNSGLTNTTWQVEDTVNLLVPNAAWSVGIVWDAVLTVVNPDTVASRWRVSSSDVLVSFAGDGVGTDFAKTIVAEAVVGTAGLIQIDFETQCFPTDTYGYEQQTQFWVLKP